MESVYLHYCIVVIMMFYVVFVFAVVSFCMFVYESSTNSRDTWDVCQGFHSSWKVTEVKKGIFQAWNVTENDCGHGMSWNSTDRSWTFLGVFTIKLKEYKITVSKTNV